MSSSGTGDMTILTNDDDTVTLTAGEITVYVKAPTWKEANEVAWTIGGFITGRTRLKCILRDTSQLKHTVTEVVRMMDLAEQNMRAIVDATVPVRREENNG